MPVRVGFAPWQLLTYAFLHANFMHLFLNMFGLYTFGRDVERAAGSRRFATLYFASVLTAGVTQLLVVSLPPVTDPYPTVGASGGVFGVLLAFAVLYPRRTVALIIPPVPMPAWLFVTLYGAAELLQGVTGTASGVAHFAHLGGMAGAWLVLRRWRR
jgi:membrane associated rhomboid family serine protease